MIKKCAEGKKNVQRNWIDISPKINRWPTDTYSTSLIIGEMQIKIAMRSPHGNHNGDYQKDNK